MKTAKQLIDALVEAVQDFDGSYARSGGRQKDDSAYRKARRELREALLSARKKKEVPHAS